MPLKSEVTRVPAASPEVALARFEARLAFAVRP